MIEGALPTAAADPLLAAFGVPAPAADDPEAAELFAALVAQLLGAAAVPTPAADVPAEAAPVTEAAPVADVPAVAVPAAPAEPAPVEGAAPAVDADVELPVEGAEIEAPAEPVAVKSTEVAPDEPTEPAGLEIDAPEPAAEPLVESVAVARNEPSEPTRPEIEAPEPDAEVEPVRQPPRAAAAAAPEPAPAPRVEASAPTTPSVTAPIGRAEAPAPAAAAAPAAPPPPVYEPPATQVVARVVALDLATDGRHELSMELNPEELGSVGVDVVVDNGKVHVALRPEQAPAADLLRTSLDELRRLLTDTGLDVGDLNLANDGDRGRHGDDAGSGRQGRPAPQTRDDDLLAAVAARTLRLPIADRGVDVLL